MSNRTKLLADGVGIPPETPGQGTGDDRKRFREFWLLNKDTGDVYSLGPMYGGTVEYARRKLEAERLSYDWTLLAPVSSRMRPTDDRAERSSPGSVSPLPPETPRQGTGDDR